MNFLSDLAPFDHCSPFYKMRAFSVLENSEYLMTYFLLNQKLKESLPHKELYSVEYTVMLYIN